MKFVSLTLRLILAAIALTCAGCSALRFETDSGRYKQLGLTALIALDAAQTVTIARSSECLYEGNPLAADIFGSRMPSPSRVILTNMAYIAAHWAVGSWLDRKANANIDPDGDIDIQLQSRERWRVMRNVYQFATLAGHSIAVGNKAARGIKPFSAYQCGRQ